VHIYVGVTLEEGTGATMSEEDEDEAPMLEVGLVDMGSDGHDMMGFGPLLPTDSERSLMERVRQELKIELKQVKKKILEACYMIYTTSSANKTYTVCACNAHALG
jgi:hypothetical protein